MARLPHSFYVRLWAIANEEKLKLLNEAMRRCCPTDRQIIEIMLGEEKYADIKRPSLRKVASIVGLSKSTIQRRVVKIGKLIPKNIF